MTQRVLEVGAGYLPAIVNPGTKFTQEGASYEALDAVRVEEPTTQYDDHESLLAITKTIMDASVMPYDPESFDHVIYRSVFGAYTPHVCDTAIGEPYEPHETGWQGSTWAKTLASIAESYRVLTPGGRVCIAEEDTPIRKSYLVTELARVGFNGITHIPSNLTRPQNIYEEAHRVPLIGNRDWLEARGVYWSNVPRCVYIPSDIYRPNSAAADAWTAPAFSGNFRYNSQPYILTATKPEQDT